MLQSLGITVQQDADAFAEGVIRWSFVVPDGISAQGDLHIDVTFPDFYPYLRPDVVALNLDMAHHQHPFGKNLCLIGRRSASWDTHNTLAWLIEEQLPKAVRAGLSAQQGEDEEAQGEPFSDYYAASYSANAMVLVDSDWALPAEMAGGFASMRIVGATHIEGDAAKQFVVTELRGDDSRPLVTMPDSVVRLYATYPQWTARWSRVDTAIRAEDPRDIWDIAEAADGPHARRSQTHLDVEYELRLVAFPEEHSLTASGVGWVLLMKQTPKITPPKGKQSRSGNPARRLTTNPGPTYQLIRGGRIGSSDMNARIGSLGALSVKRVLLIGAGAVGSVIAEQLARAGVGTLTVIDPDVLEPGNLVRHAASLPYVGAPKSVAATKLAEQVNPYIKVTAHTFAVGHQTSQRRVLEEEYKLADIIIDATAEVGVQRLTSDLARRAGKTWIAASATNGARGGAIVRVPVSSAWCFSCFEWSRADNQQLIPPAAATPLIQPIGCADPTFTGSSYDLNEVANHAVRTVIAAVLDKPAHDVSILTLEQQNGADLPSWEAHSMSRHSHCEHE